MVDRDSLMRTTHSPRGADGKGVELDMRITAGVGSDHVDRVKAVKRNFDVCEVSFFCNSISASEHVVMMILFLVRKKPSLQISGPRQGGISQIAFSGRMTLKV